MKVYFENREFDGQLLRTLSYTYYAGADIGECLSTAGRIADGDREGWYREWLATADRVAATAEASHAAGQPKWSASSLRKMGSNPGIG